jgi:SAM-dependent methyltransferase
MPTEFNGVDVEKRWAYGRALYPPETRRRQVSVDSLASFKAAQKLSWERFAPLEVFTTPAAARLTKHAKVRAGQRVLDVACGTGVVAITASRQGARTTGLDLTPALLERARENSRIAEVEIDWREGDAECLPFPDSEFDVVLSQFGHMFAPRPEVVVSEMLRVLKSGGTIAFSTWPPEHFVGRRLAMVSRYLPPPPSGVSPPTLWGDPQIVSERLGHAVTNIVFDRATMLVPSLSVQHFRAAFEQASPPVIKLVESLSATDPAKLIAFRGECDALAAEYFDLNLIRQNYLLTRASKI